MNNRTVTMQPAGSYYAALSFTIDEAGVARNEIGRPAMDDMVKHLTAQGAITAAEAAATRAAYAAAITEVFAAYRAAYRGPSAEQRAEARAAHGAGVVLVDVISGHRWTT
jgi:hypothetical protein